MVMVQLLSACLSVRPYVFMFQHRPTAAKPLLHVCCCGPSGQQISIDCCTAVAGECGQCHAVSVRRKQNTVLFYIAVRPFIVHAFSALDR